MRDLQIIVVAPTGRDSQLICDLLARVGIPATRCADVVSACEEAQNGVGAFVLADEVLTDHAIDCVARFVGQQPSWSDVPVIVLTSSGQVTVHSETRRKVREPLGNVLLIERPARPETLISTVNSALRARRRQYEVRDHLAQDRLASDALRKTEKLAVVGRLAATIAHEINNPLEAITNLHYLIGSATTLDEAKQYLSIADQELARVVEIATQTLRFHRESNMPVEVDVTVLMESVLKLYARRCAAYKIKVERKFERSAMMVGFAGELRQVFVNLVSNALDAMPNGGTLRVRIGRPYSLDGSRKGIHVLVADTGSGIPKKMRTKIFEPFVTTKEDTGTGLGLWVSSEIVRKHSGRLRFRTREGCGTVFSISLPTTLANLQASTTAPTGEVQDESVARQR